MSAWAIVAGLAVLVSLAEYAARQLRLADYIRYLPDDSVGYLAAPLTSGKLRNRFRWEINGTGMRTGHDGPLSPGDVLLLGDSIVEGGSSTDQADTVGELLSERCGRKVYPACAGGWSLQNAFAYLHKYPGLYRATITVVVTNSEDLGLLNRWSSESTHPRRVPRLHIAYVARRYSRPWRWRLKEAAKGRGVASPVQRDLAPELATATATFFAAVEGRVIWVLYPDRAETNRGNLPCLPLRPFLGRAELVEVLNVSGWSDGCYADAIHPNAKGRDLLASAIAHAIQFPPTARTDMGV